MGSLFLHFIFLNDLLLSHSGAQPAAYLPFLTRLCLSFQLCEAFEALRRTRITVNSGEQSHFAAENTTICLTYGRR